MLPTVGRIVHYTNLGDKDGKYPPQVQAALITAVYRTRRGPDGASYYERINEGVPEEADRARELAVDLKVFYNTGIFDTMKVPQATTLGQRGAWTWPQKV